MVNHQKCAGNPNAPPYHLPTGQDCITSLLHVDLCMLSEAILEAQGSIFCYKEVNALQMLDQKSLI